MAKGKKEEGPKGPAPWMATFSDLMNLLLCFFVLLFSMSSVDAEKFELVIASLQSSMSILPTGGSSIGDGNMVGAGVNQLEFLDNFFNEIANSKSEDGSENEGIKDITKEYEEQELAESEKMAEDIEQEIAGSGLQNMVEVEFNAQYVKLSLSGAILFESGKSELVKDAYSIVDKISTILNSYKNNIIEVEGHTDNVPISSSKKYEDNDVLSMYRALNVANYIREKSEVDPSHIKSSGRGDYVPVADNSTAEGRARNRRVEIKIYNSFNSDMSE